MTSPFAASGPVPHGADGTFDGMLGTESTLQRRIVVVSALLAAVVVSIVTSSQTYVAMIDHGHDWWRLFLWHVAGWSFWAVAAPWVLALGSRLLRPERRPRWWPLWLSVAMVVAGIAHVAVTAAVFTILQPYEPVAASGFVASLGRMVRSWWQVDPLIFAALVVVGYGLAGYRASRRAALQRTRLEAELSKARLEALQLQIQPHFLMNTLNAIAALIRRRDNDQALDMVVGLSGLLHTTLDPSRGPVVPLRDEIAFLERYTALQKARFPDRLHVTFDIGDDCLDVPVPTMLLQPLVENAIRHGVGKHARGGAVDVRAARRNGHMRLVVADDGKGFGAGFDAEAHGGIGLRNVRSRLVQHFGPAATFTIADRGPDGGAVVTLEWPFEAAT